MILEIFSLFGSQKNGFQGKRRFSAPNICEIRRKKRSYVTLTPRFSVLDFRSTQPVPARVAVVDATGRGGAVSGLEPRRRRRRPKHLRPNIYSGGIPVDRRRPGLDFTNLLFDQKSFSGIFIEFSTKHYLQLIMDKIFNDTKYLYFNPINYVRN
jgi:hypothetical protein